MSSSDPNNPYRNDPYGPPPHQRPDPSSEHPLAPPPGPYGSPSGPPGAMPSKVNSSRLIFFIAGGIQAALSVLLMIAFAAAEDRLEDTYGDLGGVDTGAYYTLFVLFLLHAIAGIVLATRFPRGGSGLRIAAIVWSALLILLGIAALPLGLLWIALGIVCVVLLASSESAAWFDRPRT
ncbi:hypothetical protein F0L17_16410 [Streptomyces sp. TRM43335]|uniref:Uncharacterized protein n=1 Tax=Streptomyces taklimakanensis TaxID=2569853 RepID=A0A6G2BF23_9ACTN|nr:hypothetical protein [Streptomyces taklimakanensis]MTE20663.1 hypothetical protein [Streptomyces taklimakanensis]